MAWSVWVLSREGARALLLPECGEVCLGQSKESALPIIAEGVAAKHLELRTHKDGFLYAQALAPTLLNDVQLGGTPRLRSGDELVIGQARVLVLEQQRFSRNVLCPRRDFESFREGAFATPGPLAMLLLGIPASKDQPALRALFLSALPENAWASELGPRALEVVVPGVDAQTATQLASRLTELGASPTAQVHRHQGHGGLEEAREELLGRFLGLQNGWLDEVTHADPVVLRVLAALERHATDSSQWILWGEPGSGKHTLARLAAEHAVRPLSFELSETPLPPTHTPWVLPVPPLRDRPQDVIVLAESILASLVRATGRSALSLTDSAKKALLGHSFPGNVRELKNLIASAMVASSGTEVSPESLPFRVQQAAGPLDAPDSLRTALDEREREALLGTLSKTRWNVTQAAQLLNIPRRTVIYRMARLGLKRPAR